MNRTFLSLVTVLLFAATLFLSPGCDISIDPPNVDPPTPTPREVPIADAGVDKTVDVGSSVTLSGANSSDSDGDPLTYHWEQTGGPTVTLEGGNTMVATFMANEEGTYDFSLTVNDDRRGSDTDTVRIEAVRGSGEGQPPVPEAGADRQVRENHEVQLDGRASYDLDGTNDIVIYEWRQLAGPEVTLYDANTATPTFTAPEVDEPTELIFELYVEDNATLWSTDAVIITVLPIGSGGSGGMLDQYNLAVVVVGQGSVEPDGGAYDAGTIVTLTATPAAGWEFDCWEEDLTVCDNPASLEMDSNKFVVASFTRIQYTLSMSVEGGGDTDPAVGQRTYNAGDQVTITATPDEGCQESYFQEWSGDASGSTNPLTITMDSHKDITAIFDANNHAPIADDQEVSTDLNATVNITLTGDDPDGDELDFFIIEPPSSGHLLETELPLVTYIPNNDFEGTDTFRFQVTDGCFDSDEATVTIYVGVACVEEGGQCVENADCCTDLECVDGVCEAPEQCAAEGEDCDADADCCAGLICGEQGECVPTTECETDDDCDDNLFCNGAETCVDGQCQAGAAPCAPGQTCDEENDVCLTGGNDDTLHSGEMVSGCIDAPSDQNTWLFSGTAGERVRILVTKISGDMIPCVYLYPPGGGSAEASAGCWIHDTATIDWQLSATGQYTIVVQDNGADDMGCYNLAFINLSDTLTSALDPDGGPISSGETVSAQINAASDMDGFTFSAVAAQHVRIVVTKTSGDMIPCVYLYPPGGGSAEASAGCWIHDTATIDRQLSATGQYTILVEDNGANDAGGYNLTLQQF
ncbi:MAG: hypothetical protein KAV82_12665 [Phycisphaerae bacterium]|nr:hypothetical protein [Phycisphaerae bacterium]